ncbi:hypothetical protein [Sphingosinithalassobacter portus]|uniref:hypothetical protein n=1 Tax=Stakelama portus TaxID=2676234 RepID=UPI0011AB45C5|nr:hypothetical protein [Sphingosinithalassobacter portus]
MAHVTAAGDVLATAAILLLLRHSLIFVPGMPRRVIRWTGRIAALFALLPGLRMLVTSRVADPAMRSDLFVAGMAILAVVVLLAFADAPIAAFLRRARRQVLSRNR